MYDMFRLIEQGRKVMQHNTSRDITMFDMKTVKDSSNDEYHFAEMMFLAGVAIGARIGQGTEKAASEVEPETARE